MKIYFSHKRSDLQDELYPVLTSIPQHQFIFPHESSSEPFNSKQAFQNQEVDLVLAEVSEPATGQGIELGWANLLNILIVCVYKKGTKPANSLKVISNKFFEYSSDEEIKFIIERL